MGMVAGQYLPISAPNMSTRSYRTTASFAPAQSSDHICDEVRQITATTATRRHSVRARSQNLIAPTFAFAAWMFAFYWAFVHLA
jgi:hypothetical protein